MQEAVYCEYLDHLVTGDRLGCKTIVSRLLAQETPLMDLYEGLFQRSLYEVGSRWERNLVSVATEHLATAITEWLMTLAYPALFRGEHTGRRVVVTCGENEFHQVGAKMVADIFEMRGWDSYFLGANTPVESLVSLLDEKAPDLLCVSLSLYFGMPGLLRLLERVRSHDDGLEIFVGGQAFNWGGTDSLARFRGVTYVPSLKDLDQRLSGK
jgi:MerR family transcriptional regulator, light-induced transcriptional regulator